MESRHYDIETVNQLIKTTIDSVDGYRSAAEAADSQQFQSIFSNARMNGSRLPINYVIMCVRSVAIPKMMARWPRAHTACL